MILSSNYRVGTNQTPGVIFRGYKGGKHAEIDNSDGLTTYDTDHFIIVNKNIPIRQHTIQAIL